MCKTENSFYLKIICENMFLIIYLEMLILQWFVNYTIQYWNIQSWNYLLVRIIGNTTCQSEQLGLRWKTNFVIRD